MKDNDNRMEKNQELSEKEISQGDVFLMTQMTMMKPLVCLFEEKVRSGQLSEGESSASEEFLQLNEEMKLLSTFINVTFSAD